MQPGDPDDAVLARRRWLASPAAAGLIEALRDWGSRWISTGDRGASVIDLGCGEGSLAPVLFPDHADGYCGIDLSKRAIKLAARHWPEATWVWANADRGLPAGDATADYVVSLFGRRPASEIARVLNPEGTVLIAVPGEEDLIELREAAKQEGHRRSRVEKIVDTFATAGLSLQDHQTWRDTQQLDRETLRDALTMTYRGIRKSEQSRLAAIDSMEVTFHAELICFTAAKKQQSEKP